jgi:hypothetical protein
MQTRRELLRIFALDALADDDENLEAVTRYVAYVAGRCGLTFGRSEVASALEDVVESGLAVPYMVYAHGTPPRRIERFPYPAELEDCWFRGTPEARELVEGYAGWPFDEAGNLRQEWSPPTA